MEVVMTAFLKGRLYLRLHDGEPWNLFYPESDVPDDYYGFSLMGIADLRRGYSEPAFGGATEMAHHGERMELGYVVAFRAATDADIVQLFETWGNAKYYPIAEWLRNVKAPPNELHEDELARLEHIAAKFVMAE